MEGERGILSKKKSKDFIILAGCHRMQGILESKRFQWFVYKGILNEFDEILGLQMMKHSSIQLI